MSAGLVNLSVADGLATIELNRPHRKNAIIGPMMDELADAVEAASADATVNAILLCGADGAFCSGLDLKEVQVEPKPDWLATQPQSLRRAHLALAQCPHPVIVALERFAINGGAAFALAGDIVVVGEKSFLQVGEVKLGMAAPNNLAWLCARYAPATVLPIVLIGDRLYGQRMVELGLAYESVADELVRTRATELATQIAGYPKGAAAALKKASLELAGLGDAAAWFERVGAPVSGSLPTDLMRS